MVKSKLLNPTDLELIKSAVQKVELETAGEIVTMVLPRSDSYTFSSLIFSLVFWCITSLTLLLSPFHWALTTEQLIEIQSVALFFGFLLGKFPYFIRLFTPYKILNQIVHKQALAEFMASGLHETKDHTGILILISELEHIVVIIGDSGIHTKAGEGAWKKEVAHIIQGIRNNEAGKHIAESIKNIGLFLKIHFPRDPNDKNELPDEVIVKTNV